MLPPGLRLGQLDGRDDAIAEDLRKSCASGDGGGALARRGARELLLQRTPRRLQVRDRRRICRLERTLRDRRPNVHEELRLSVHKDQKIRPRSREGGIAT